MDTFPFALYDAFSEIAFGGSPAAVITDAGSITRDQRQRIAREVGMPATAFVEGVGDNWVAVQFMSTVMELPMCGHGTLCLMTHLLESESDHITGGLGKLRARISPTARCRTCLASMPLQA